MTPIVADTDEQAEQKLREYTRCASDDGALVLYGGWSGLDLSQYQRDEPLQYVENNAIQSAVHTFTRADPNRDWTPEDIARHIGIGGMVPVFVRSPTTVADRIDKWVDQSGVDGFNIAYPVTPGTFEDIVELVVPELRERGCVRDSRTGTTVREPPGRGRAAARRRPRIGLPALTPGVLPVRVLGRRI